MKNIYYNSTVARLCGSNGIIKAVLLNYIYNYHKPNIRKQAGSPASITLAEFVYQYSCEEKSLWKRSFIHRILKDLEKDGHITIAKDNNLSVYSVTPRIVELLTDENSKVISFDLELACGAGIGRFLGRFKVWAKSGLSNRSMPSLKRIDNFCIYMNSALSVCLGP